jgi:hypothetical protein
VLICDIFWNMKYLLHGVLLAILLTGPAWPEISEEGPLDEAVSVAKKTLSEKFEVDESELDLISVEPIEWRGSGIQCHDSGKGPVVAGHTVRLKIGTNCFEVRVADEEARICGFHGKNQLMTPGTIEPELQDQVDKATADLAARINTTPAKIEVLEAVSVVWRDSSMGCPKPGMDYLQVLTKGVRIRLRFGLNVFEYHGAGGRAPQFCEHPSNVEPLLGGHATE